MGGHHSKCPTCNYGYYQNQIKALKSQAKTSATEISGLKSKLSDETKQSEKCQIDAKKVKQMCMVPDNESIKNTGERIYSMLNGRYRENIKLIDTQQRLMDRHNRSIGRTDTVLSEQRETLKKLNDKITQNDRQLEYDNQLYHGDNKWIKGLKISAVFMIVALIGVMILSSFKTLRKK
jgi:hypothetical protein